MWLKLSARTRRLIQYAGSGALGAEPREALTPQARKTPAQVHRLWPLDAVRLASGPLFMRNVMLLTGLMIVMCSASSAYAQVAPEPPSIVTQGDATVRHAADVAWVQIAAETRAPKPEDARRMAAQAMTSVMTAIRRSVPSDAIKTSGFSLQPDMEFPPNERARVRGYIARNQVEVRVDDLEKLPAVLDASVAGGATSIAGLRFDLKKRDEAEREALGLAVEDAMARAAAIARGARRELGAIIRINEQRMFPQPMMRMASGMAQDMAANSTPITPGEVEIRSQVMLTIGIR
jgi:uncharacterized protein YggE